MTYLVLDIETEGTTIRSRFCDPLERHHKVVMIQTKLQDTEPSCQYSLTRDLRSARIADLDSDLSALLVGQNFKFDLLYLWNNPSIREWIKNGGKIWDTKTVDYLINCCQPHLKYSLDDIAKRYGTETKYDPIKELYKGNKKLKREPMTTKQIIETQGIMEFTKYAVQDVIVTEQIYLKQVEKVKELGMEKLVDDYMQYYKVLVEMEYNGMFVNKDVLDECTTPIRRNVEQLENEIKLQLRLNDLWPEEVQLNLHSVDHLSLLLFGGILKIENVIPMVDLEGNKIVWKSGKNEGQQRVKRHAIEFPIAGMKISTEISKSQKKKGYFKVDKDVILVAVDNCCDKVKPILEKIIEFKKQYKLLGDFTDRIQANVNPDTRCLHSEYNTTSTATGRLSSSNPGSQNLHPATKAAFTSRYGDEGVIIEVDWSQIEVVMAAVKFHEKVLVDEIRNKVDMHKENAARLFSISVDDVTPAQRRLAKFMTFGILYGQSAPGLAAKFGITEQEAELFIITFYNKYAKIKQAHERLKILAKTCNDEVCVLQAGNGKLYAFTRYEYGFKPTQLKNYIIQGSAGDLHAYCVGKLFDFLLTNKNLCVIINNIHDSVMFDCVKSHSEWIADVIKTKMEYAAYEYTGSNLFTVDVKIGRTWAECKT